MLSMCMSRYRQRSSHNAPHAFGRYVIGFGDQTNPDYAPGVNGGISANNPFIGTRFFALHNLPWNQYNFWFFQWTVRIACCLSCCFDNM